MRGDSCSAGVVVGGVVAFDLLLPALARPLSVRVGANAKARPKRVLVRKEEGLASLARRVTHKAALITSIRVTACAVRRYY